MITVTFDEGSTSATVTDEVYQFDYGQTLQINGLELPDSFDVDFSFGNNASYGSIIMEGQTDGDVSTVEIPNSILAQDVTKDYRVYIYIFFEETETNDEGEEVGISGETTYVITMPVKTRPKRSN